MKKNVLFFCLSILNGFVFGQVYEGQVDSSIIPKLNLHFQEEYTEDLMVDSLDWIYQKTGLNVSFGSTDRLYLRSGVPESEDLSQSLVKTCWRGERINAVILVWSPDTISQVDFKLSDFISQKGEILSKDNVQLNILRYVLSNYPYGAADITCGDSPYKGAYLMPDRFEPFERFDVPGRTVRPVWLNINIPSSAESGFYTGNIIVRSLNQSDTLNLHLKIQDQLLPEPQDWKYRLDLWQNPWVTARYYNIKPWSEDHKIILKNHLKLYADMGGKYITTYAVHSPWADVTYRLDEAMVDWIKDKNGKWKFDYAIFDQYIELAMEVGIDEAITIYTPIPWGNRFRYLDEKTGNHIYETWAPDSSAFKNFWNIFLDDLKNHLEDKGWLEKTYLGINENELNQTISAIKVINENSPEWKITYAGDWHPELDSLLDDYSCIFSKEPSMEDIKKRSARGSTTTYYICCYPPKPNTFVFSPPVEARWLGWYSAAYGYDGMLRWAYDSWPADPLKDARHLYWAAGDCFLVYPGANSSIRFEKIREGIADFEKIKILKEQGSNSDEKDVKELLKELDNHLQSLTVKNNLSETYFNSSLNKGLKIIEELSDRLSN